MQVFSKSKIKSNFNKAHQSYNQAAILQKYVAKNLVNLAKSNIDKSDNIVDLGCGTGFVAEEILQKFSDKKIFQLDIAQKMLKTNPFTTPKITADIELLPFKENIFDLALSSLSFQWLNHLESTVVEVLKTVKSKGNFYFSLITDGSLQELKSTCNQCNTKLSTNDFIGVYDLEKKLSKFDYKIKLETIILPYQNLRELLKSIKSIGASYNKEKNILTKSSLDKISNFYLKNFNLNGKLTGQNLQFVDQKINCEKPLIYATWQVCYVSIKL